MTRLERAEAAALKLNMSEAEHVWYERLLTAEGDLAEQFVYAPPFATPTRDHDILSVALEVRRARSKDRGLLRLAKLKQAKADAAEDTVPGGLAEVTGAILDLNLTNREREVYRGHLYREPGDRVPVPPFLDPRRSAAIAKAALATSALLCRKGIADGRCPEKMNMTAAALLSGRTVSWIHNRLTDRQLERDPERGNVVVADSLKNLLLRLKPQHELHYADAEYEHHVEILSLTDAALKLGVSTATVRNMRWDGRLEQTTIDGQHAVTARSVEQLIEDRSKPAEGDFE